MRSFWYEDLPFYTSFALRQQMQFSQLCMAELTRENLRAKSVFVTNVRRENLQLLCKLDR